MSSICNKSSNENRDFDERQNEKSELVWVESSYHHLSILAIHDNRHFCYRTFIIAGPECSINSIRKKIISYPEV